MRRVISPHAVRSKPTQQQKPCATCAKVRAAALALGRAFSSAPSRIRDVQGTK